MNPHALNALLALEEARAAIIRQEAHILAESKNIPIQKAVEEVENELEFVMRNSGLW